MSKRVKDAIFTQAKAWVSSVVEQAIDEERVAPSGAPEIRAARELLLEEELEGKAWDGTWYVNGVRYLQRATPDYDRPWIARGLGVDLGSLERLWRTSVQFQRGVSTVIDHATSGHWRVDPPVEDKCNQIISNYAQRQLFGISGGWRQFVSEAIQSICIAGFAVFVRVDSKGGGLKSLAMRRPNTVYRWIFDEHDKLAGVEFRSRSGANYMIDAQHLLIMTANKMGQDFEGTAPLRSAAVWIKAKQLAGQLWTAGLEKYGSPIVVIEDEDRPSGENASLEVIDLFEQVSADQFACIKLGQGQKAYILSPGENLADYEGFVRYCDEQIMLPLSSEGALVGLNDTGAYALADIKDAQHLRVAVAFARIISDAINGDRWQAHNGVVRHIVDTLLSVDHGYEYPSLVYALGDQDAPLDAIVKAVEKGLIEVTPEVRAVIHDRLSLPAPPDPDDDSEVQDPNLAAKAFNGAQVTSMRNLVIDVAAGAVPLKSGRAMLRRAYQISEADARAILPDDIVSSSSSAPAPPSSSSSTEDMQ